MSKKYFTLIIVSDATTNLKQLKIPYYLTHGLIVLGVVLCLTIPTAAYFMVKHYRAMTVVATDLPKMRKETREQKFLIDRYAHDVNDLQQTISRLKLANEKLMVMAGVDAKTSAQMSFQGMGGETDTGEMAKLIQESEQTMLQKIDNLKKLKEAAVSQEELAQRLMEFFQDQKTLLAATPSVWPVKGWVTSEFGSRKSPFTGHAVMHEGLDIATKTGTPILAPADGVVAFAGFKDAFGRVLVIDHGYGYTTFYAHCSSLEKNVGDKVKRGDLIAHVGSSGRTTGPHLHYEVRANGIATNPTKFILDL